MDDKLVDELEALCGLTKQRVSTQGLKIYKIALAQLRDAQSIDEVRGVHSRLKEALIGIDSHGLFTPVEHQIVKRILEY